MPLPSVVIAANPYEAELCRRALVETGLRVVVAESGEGALDLVRAEEPLVLVVAIGIFGCDPLALLREVRAELPAVAVFLIADREGAVPDEDAAARLGAKRLFLRPIEAEALADAIEKRAVEAEVASEVAAAMAEFDTRPKTIDAAPLVEEAIVEMEAEYGHDDEAPPQPLARIPLRQLAREPTEVLKGVIDVPAKRPHVEVKLGKVEVSAEPTAAPPPTVAAPEPLLRADDALVDVGLSSLVVAPDFVARAPSPRTSERRGEAAARGEASARSASAPGAPSPPSEAAVRGAAVERAARAPDAIDERSTFARRLENELSAAERRLFPDSPSTASAARDEYEDALGDIDLDSLGIDTIPGISNQWVDALDPALESRPARNGNGNGHGGRAAERATPPTPAPRLLPEPALPPPDDEGDLASVDVATLLARLHAAGFSGAVTLSRGDGDKILFFDAGAPVAARSTFAHDRLADLLLREGSITREQHGRARAAGASGRAAAQAGVGLGVIQSSELFATLRRHVEEILYSCFAWERGHYRLSHAAPAPEERVRLGAHPWALFVEGVRRKYGLERLVELVGPPETVLTPTTLLSRALEDAALDPAERVRCELFDGERTLGEVIVGAGAPPLPEAALYAVVWALTAIGALRPASADEVAAGVRSVPTLVTASYGERRTRPRPAERARDRDADGAVDRERVLAKRAQVQDGDYFAVLGLGRDASAREVARAFERLKREFAPDRYSDPVRQELGDALVEIGEVLDEAHRVLADDALRAAYRGRLPEA